jgi:phosphate transport system permease protein
VLREDVEPWLEAKLGFLPFFRGPSQGVGMLAAATILAIMILPTVSSVAREVLKAVPTALEEGALALGATRWETLRGVVLPYARSGIIGAVILGLGRALGETMAVTMVIGNRAEISASIFAPSYTMASVIANEFTEATGDIYLSALAEIGLLLFAVTLLLNVLARLLVRAIRVPQGGRT